MWITSSLFSQLIILEASCVGGLAASRHHSCLPTFQQHHLLVCQESHKGKGVTLFVRMSKFWLTTKSNGFVWMHISLKKNSRSSVTHPNVLDVPTYVRVF